MITRTITFHTNDDTEYELFINADGNIYIGEIGEDQNQFSCVVLPAEDWKGIKAFIESELKNLKS